MTVQIVINTVIYRDRFLTSIGELRLAATSQGICRIFLEEDAEEDDMRWYVNHFQKFVISDEKSPTRNAREQILLYLAGRLTEFTIPLDIHGTHFQKNVWQAVSRIPRGSLQSYQTIAQSIGRPKATRAVGSARRANPLPIIIPSHRVIHLGSTKHLSPIQKALLDLEGVLNPQVDDHFPKG